MLRACGAIPYCAAKVLNASSPNPAARYVATHLLGMEDAANRRYFSSLFVPFGAESPQKVYIGHIPDMQSITTVNGAIRSPTAMTKSIY